MRIACLSTDPGIAWGGAKGASVHLAEIVEALRAEDVEMLVLVSQIVADAPAPARGVTLESLPGPRKGIPVDALLAAEDALAAWLVGRLQDFRADALYERIALHSAAGSTAARALGIPHIVELNAPLPRKRRATGGSSDPRTPTGSSGPLSLMPASCCRCPAHSPPTRGFAARSEWR